MINVMLVDDQNLVRKGVRSLLELSEEIEVVAEAADGAEAIRTIPEVKPDVVLLDMRMPGKSGLDVLSGNCPQRTNCRRPSFSLLSMMMNSCSPASRREQRVTC